MRTKPYSEKGDYKATEFYSNMLEIGEMMEITDPLVEHKKGDILLRTYSGLVNLNNPANTFLWERSNIAGRKLLPGEGITLIQE